jgi:hypothetical protein
MLFAAGSLWASPAFAAPAPDVSSLVGSWTLPDWKFGYRTLARTARTVTNGAFMSGRVAVTLYEGLCCLGTSQAYARGI